LNFIAANSASFLKMTAGSYFALTSIGANPQLF
jgi:hypothetical protein